MNENINLCEILKDTPKGTKFYTPLCGEVEFDIIMDFSHYPIRTTTNNNYYYFTKEGCYETEGTPECLLFPSKDQRDWSKYQRPFKDGDILTTKLGSIFIYHYSKLEEMSNKSICCAHIAINPTDKTILNNDEFSTYMSMCSFATEEEKQKLFQTIKDNGYCWDEETNTLKQLTKFKVGDRIRAKDNGICCTLENYSEGISAYRTDIGLSLTYKDLEQWEFAPNKFDISTLKPFDKVLVRNGGQDKWQAGLFSYLEEKKIGVDYGSYTKYFKGITTYNVNSDFYNYCIPYNYDTKHLVGTTKEAPEFYQIEYETSLID